MRYEKITPDMQVKIGDAPGVVLHTRPASSATDAVFVLNYIDGLALWVTAARLTNRNMTPSLPTLLRSPDGNEGDPTFWYLGHECRVRSDWRDGSGPWTVEHVAEDGTRTVVMRGQRDATAAMQATVTAMTAMRAIGVGGAPVEYLVEAADRNVFPLRATEHPDADEDGRLHVASLAEVPAVVEGFTRATARDFLTAEETRRAIYHWGAYPVYADGSLGQPTLYRP
ncbi:hypothetical protein [Streptomyces anulatus]|uniref:hypothetical protein n=1 Tax=Streptomyces anulatus TaxID=1892 RepID=UPI002F9193C8